MREDGDSSSQSEQMPSDRALVLNARKAIGSLFLVQGNVSKNQTAVNFASRWQRCQRHATHMPFEHAGSQHVFVRGPAGRPGTVAMSKAGFRELHAHAE